MWVKSVIALQMSYLSIGLKTRTAMVWARGLELNGHARHQVTITLRNWKILVRVHLPLYMTCREQRIVTRSCLLQIVFQLITTVTPMM